MNHKNKASKTRITIYIMVIMLMALSAHAYVYFWTGDRWVTDNPSPTFYVTFTRDFVLPLNYSIEDYWTENVVRDENDFVLWNESQGMRWFFNQSPDLPSGRYNFKLSEAFTRGLYMSDTEPPFVVRFEVDLEDPDFAYIFLPENNSFVSSPEWIRGVAEPEIFVDIHIYNDSDLRPEHLFREYNNEPTGPLYQPNSSVFVLNQTVDNTTIIVNGRLDTQYIGKYVEFLSRPYPHYLIVNTVWVEAFDYTEVYLNTELEFTPEEGDELVIYNEEYPSGYFAKYSAFPLGKAYVTARVRDYVNNTKGFFIPPLVVTNDPFSPFITVINPINGTRTGETDFNLSFEAEDTISGVDVDRVSVTIFDGTNTTNLNCSSSSVVCEPSSGFASDLIFTYSPSHWEYASYDVTAVVYDAANNNITNEWSFEIISNVPSMPTVTMTKGNEFDNTIYTNNKTPDVQIVFNRDENVNLTFVSIPTEPLVLTNNITVIDVPENNSFMLSVNESLTEKSQVLYMQAKKKNASDEWGPVGEFYKPFVIDITYPVLQISNITYVTELPFIINGEFLDANLDSFGGYIKFEYYDPNLGNTFQVYANITSSNTYEANFTHFMGPFTQTIPVNVTICDKAGNCNVTKTNLLFDNTLPTVSHVGAPLGWINRTMTINITANDPGANPSGIEAIYVCEGANCTPQNGMRYEQEFISLIYDIDQNKTYRYQALDKAGNPSMIGNFTVLIDSEPPITELRAVRFDGTPYEEGTYSNQTVIINLNATDSGSGINWTRYCYNETPNCDVENGVSGTDFEINTEGTFHLKYASQDNVGNTEEAQAFTISVDLSGITIEITNITATTPGKMVLWNGSNFRTGDWVVSVKGNYAGDHLYRVFYNETEGSFDENSKTFEVNVSLSPGLNEYTIEAEDLAGHKAFDTFWIDLDVTGPGIQIIEPEQIGGTYFTNEGAPTFRVKTNEDANCTISILSINDADMNTTNMRNHVFTLPSPPYDLEHYTSHEVTIKCYDYQIMNLNQTTFTLYVDRASPELMLNSSSGEFQDDVEPPPITFKILYRDPQWGSIPQTNLSVFDGNSYNPDLGLNCTFNCTTEKCSDTTICGTGMTADKGVFGQPYYLETQIIPVCYDAPDPNGEYRYTITCRDKAGNYGENDLLIIVDVASELTIEETAPTGEINNPEPQLYIKTNLASECWNGSSLDDKNNPNNWFDGYLEHNKTYALQEGEGDYSINVMCQKLGETVDYVEDQVVFTFDITPPDAPTVTSPTHPVETEYYPSRTVTLNWFSADAVNYSFMLDQSELSEPDNISEGFNETITYELTSDGTWYFHVRAQDAAGNWGESSTRRINIDTTFNGNVYLDEIPDFVNNTNLPVTGVIKNMFGDPEPNGKVEIFVNNITVVNVTADQIGRFSTSLVLSQEDNLIKARGYDYIGNGPGTFSPEYYVKYVDTAPDFISVNPTNDSLNCNVTNITAVIKRYDDVPLSSEESHLNISGLAGPVDGTTTFDINGDYGIFTFIPLSEFLDNNYTVKITAADIVGNRKVYTTGFEVNQDLACIIWNATTNKTAFAQPNVYDIEPTPTSSQYVMISGNVTYTNGDPAVNRFIHLWRRFGEQDYELVSNNTRLSSDFATFNLQNYLDQGDGRYFFKVQAYDERTGSYSDFSVSKAVDLVREGPELIELWPPQGSLNNNVNGLWVTLKQRDSSLISSVELDLKYPNGTILNYQPDNVEDLGGGVFKYFFNTGLLEDGSYEATFSAEDILGNIASYVSSFEINSNAPAIDLARPDESEFPVYTTADQIHVDGNIISNNPIETAKVIVNGYDYDLIVDDSGSFGVDINLNILENTVEFVASDIYGNNASTGELLVIKSFGDTYIRILYPGEGDIIRTNAVDLVGDYNDDYVDFIEVYNSTGKLVMNITQPVGGAFLVESVNLLEGENTITAIKHDLFGQETNDTVTFTYEPVPVQLLPELNEQGPTSSGLVEISGTVNYTAGAPLKLGEVHVYANDVNVDNITVENGTFNGTIQISENSLIYVLAFDEFGRGPSFPSNTIQVYFITDPPELHSVTPPNNTVFYPGDLLWNVTAVLKPRDNAVIDIENSTISLTKEGEGVVSGSVSKGFDLNEMLHLTYNSHTLISGGRYNITIDARDVLGNQIIYRTNFEVNYNVPYVVIYEPEKFPYYTTNDSVFISGQATITMDPANNMPENATAEINGVEYNITFNGDLSQSNYPFNITLPLEQGLNHVIITIPDMLGNTAVHNFDVYYSSDPGELRITSPKNGEIRYFQNVSVEGTYTNPEVNKIELYLNGVLDKTIIHPYEGQFLFNTVLPLEGQNEIFVIAYDNYGLNASDVAYVTYEPYHVPITAHLYDIESPISSQNPSVDVVVSGNATYIDGTPLSEGTVEIFVNDESRAVISVEPDGSFSTTVSIDELYNFVKVLARDANGNPSEFSNVREVIFINRGPELISIDPADGVIRPGVDNVTVVLQQIDSMQIDVGETIMNSYILGPNMQNAINSFAFTYENGILTIVYDINSTLSGEYTVHIGPVDLAGLYSEYDTSFTIDRGAPNITFVEPSEFPYYVLNSPLQITGSVSSGNGISEAYYYVNSEQFPLILDGSSFNISVDLQDGENIIEFDVTDNLGYEAYEVVQVFKTETSTGIWITSPPNNDMVPEDVITIEGTYDDYFIDRIEVFVEGAYVGDADYYNGAFSKEIILPNQGDNLVRVVEYNIFNQTVSDSINVVYNPNMAEIFIFGDNPYYTTSNYVTFEGSIGSTYPIEDINLTFNITTLAGNELIRVPIQGSPPEYTFNYTVDLVEGETIIVIQAESPPGDSNTGELVFISDRTPPKVVIESPASGSVVSAEPITLSGTYNDSYKDIKTLEYVDTISNMEFYRNMVLIGGTQPERGMFSFEMPLLDGNNLLRVVGNDILDNTNYDEVSIILDTTPPTITISNVSAVDGTIIINGFGNVTTNSEQVTITGTYNDENIQTIYREGTIEEATLNEDNSTFSITLTLNPGWNNVRMIAEDKAGLQGESEQLSIFYDDQPTLIGWLEPLRQITREEKPMIRISTSREATCEMIYYDWQDVQFREVMNTGNGLEHYERPVNKLIEFTEQDYKRTPIKFRCTDSLNAITEQTYFLELDARAIEINDFGSTNGYLFFENAAEKYYLVTDELDNRTQLHVTTSKYSKCRYGSSTDWDEMTPFLEDDYTIEHYTDIIELYNNTNYTFYVQCRDLTDWPSPLRTIHIEVNIGKLIDILNIMPEAYTNNQLPTILAVTQTNVSCYVSRAQAGEEVFFYNYETSQYESGQEPVPMMSYGKIGQGFIHSALVSGPFLLNPPQPLTENETYFVKIECVDPEGILGDNEVTFNFTVDISTPSPNITEPINGSSFNVSLITVKGTAEQGSLISLYVQSRLHDVLQLGPSQTAFEVSGALRDDHNQVTVRVRDRAGNINESSIFVNYTNIGPICDYSRVQPEGGTLNILPNTTASFNCLNLNETNSQMIMEQILVQHTEVPGTVQKLPNMFILQPDNYTDLYGTYRTIFTPSLTDGTTGRTEISVYKVDVNAPSITLIKPDLILTNNSEVRFEGVVTFIDPAIEPDLVEVVNINESFNLIHIPLIVMNKMFNDSVNLSEGNNYYYVRAVKYNPDFTFVEGTTPERVIKVDTKSPGIEDVGYE